MRNRLGNPASTCPAFVGTAAGVRGMRWTRNDAMLGARRERRSDDGDWFRARHLEPRKRTVITCRQLAEFIADSGSGALSAVERREFNEHLDLCERCGVYLDSYWRTVELGKAAFADFDAPESLHVPEQLVQAILAVLPFRT